MSKAGRRIFDGAASFFVPVKMHKPFAHRPGDANGLFLYGMAGQNADFVEENQKNGKAFYGYLLCN